MLIAAVLLQVRLDDLVELYKLVFARILTREDAKASPYTRYYIAASTPLVLKDIAILFGKTLKQLGKIEDSEPQSISVAADWPMCVWLHLSLSPRMFKLFIENKRCTSVRVSVSRQNAPRPWGGSLAL